MDKKHESSEKYYMCSMCGKQYRTRGQLTHHVNSKCGTLKQFKCKVCDQELMSAGSLHNHMLRHKGDRSFMCPFCAKLFFTAGQLKVHERIHTQDKAYVCEVCNKGFCHRQSLITHSTLHTGVKPYQCENCGNSFSCVGNLIKHRKTHMDTCGSIPLITHRVKHPSTKIKVKINTPLNSRLKTRGINVNCGGNKTEQKTQQIDGGNDQNFLVDEIKKLADSTMCTANPHLDGLGSEERDHVENQDTNTDSLKEHDTDAKSILDEDIRDEAEGHKNVKKKSLRNIHRRKVDPDQKKELSNFIKETNFAADGSGDCKYCRKKYTNPTWLFKHIKDHESSDTINNRGDPAHKCSCCKLFFPTKDEALVHQQCQHADILTCRNCSKIFANRDSLRSHQKIFHKGVSRKIYIYMCEKCGKHFKQKSYLKVHEEQDCNKCPSFECSICKKQFLSRYTRQNHMRIHDPEKKFLCKFCGKSFHWKGQLKIHERSHTGEKPFACLYCPKTFTYRESLLTHSTMHTGVKPHLCEGCGATFSCIGNLIKHKGTHAAECGSWAYSNVK